ncbi:MAG: peptidoglycan-associated lipoprotein [Acidobacteria bacterium]|nr:MAG: peptidoglycan-associated lipoprotein [Acidobacteriota bacterium]
MERAGGHVHQRHRAIHAVDGADAGRAGAGDGDGDLSAGQQERVRHGDDPSDQAARHRVHVRGRALRFRPLQPAARTLQDNPNVRIEIEGHTCNIGTAEYNLALGERRATSVREYLVSRGVGADRMRTVSYGEERPKYDNSREETRRLNRRAALVVRVTQ